jgi:hypothetical protein
MGKTHLIRLQARDVDLILHWAKGQELFWRNTLEYLLTDIPENEEMGISDCADLLQVRQNVHHLHDLSREIRRQIADRRTESMGRR